MNTYTSTVSNSSLCCHWCKIPLGKVSNVIYLNGNLPVCDLCLLKEDSYLSKKIPLEIEDITKHCHKIVYR
jgi:hypothetical protein